MSLDLLPEMGISQHVVDRVSDWICARARESYLSFPRDVFMANEFLMAMCASANADRTAIRPAITGGGICHRPRSTCANLACLSLSSDYVVRRWLSVPRALGSTTQFISGYVGK